MYKCLKAGRRCALLDSACRSRLLLTGPGCDQLTTTNWWSPEHRQSHSVTARFPHLVPRHGTVCHLRCVANLCPCSVSNILWKHSCLIFRLCFRYRLRRLCNVTFVNCASLKWQFIIIISIGGKVGCSRDVFQQQWMIYSPNVQVLATSHMRIYYWINIYIWRHRSRIRYLSKKKFANFNEFSKIKKIRKKIR